MDKDITGMLRENGFKVTPQRLAVYEALLATKEHPNAETLFTMLQPKYPTMSLATVYKTIEVLAKMGIVKVINTGEDYFRYDADISDHAHIKCTLCNKVKDIYASNTLKLISDVEKNTGYNINSQQIYFFGMCPECQKKSAN